VTRTRGAGTVARMLTHRVPRRLPTRSVRAALVGALACAVFAPSAHAAAPQKVRDAARKSANAWTLHRYGIGFRTRGGWKMWSARCRTASGGGWSCSLSMGGGQCFGTVQLTAGLRGYGHRISCGE